MNKLNLISILSFVGIAVASQLDIEKLGDFGRRAHFFKSSAEIAANPNIVDKNYGTPLTALAGSYTAFPAGKAEEIATNLINAGADVNLRRQYATLDTPLIIAMGAGDLIKSGNWYFARFLIEKGANPNLPSSIGSTPLMYAAQRDIYWTDEKNAMVPFLLKHGADATAKSKIGGETAYALANPKNKHFFEAHK